MNTYLSFAARARRSTLTALLVGSASFMLLAVGNAGACEAQPPARSASAAARPVTSWVLSLNDKVSVAARCSGMVEAIGRMLTAGSALRISILGYDKSEGSRSLSLAYVATVAEELRSVLQQKGKGQVRIRTVFGAEDVQVAGDPAAAARIEIRVHEPQVSVGG